MKVAKQWEIWGVTHTHTHTHTHERVNPDMQFFYAGHLCKITKSSLIYGTLDISHNFSVKDSYM